MLRGSDIPRRLAIAGCALVLAACSADAPTAVPATPAQPSSAVIITGASTTDDSVFVEFEVTPSGGVFTLGRNSVWFPANSICDPATSSYGVGEWDAPCTPATTPVRIRARMGTGGRGGDRSWVHFEPELRFVPASAPSRWVILYMWTPDAKKARPRNEVRAAAIEEKYKIWWVPGWGQAPVDESLDDPTLRTVVLWGSGFVYRRVKHFSGFQVGVGFASEEEREY